VGRKVEKGAGANYHFHRGVLLRFHAGMTIPNAICFSPDCATAKESFIASPSILRTPCRPRIGYLDGASVDAETTISVVHRIPRS
jgi:hypothetical protein